MANEFKEDLKVENESNWQKDAENLVLNTFLREYSKYENVFYSKENQYYFHTMIATIMMEYRKAFPSYETKIKYRFKSPKAIVDKVQEYMSRGDKTKLKVNDDGKYDLKVKELKDVFAMKMILEKTPSTFHSNDEKINKLVQEKVQNQQFMANLQTFTSKIVTDEFSATPTYSYTVTKIEYYENCKKVIERITSLISPKATKLLAQYKDIEESIDILIDNAEKDEIIDEEDFPFGKINFLELYEDFSSRIYDKLDLAVLTKQVDSLLKGSSTLKKLEVSLTGFKEKRTADGYVSNFMYLKTPFGIAELQLQSMHEFREGNYGYAAHSQMKGKQIKGYKIPTSTNKGNVEKFKEATTYISPRFFTCEFDDVEKNKVLIQGYSDYKNYRNIIGQVKEGSIRETVLLKYFDKLYSIRNEIFDSNGESFEFIPYDIEKYLESSDFIKIKEENSKEEDIEL